MYKIAIFIAIFIETLQYADKTGHYIKAIHVIFFWKYYKDILKHK